MANITVGQVSGLIALGVFLVQSILPLALAALLASFLHNEYNAVTWSVIGRSVQSSWWPTILRTDSASSRGVKLRVSVLSWLITLSVVLSTITAIVTPLGLSDRIKAHKSKPAHFEYAPDRSPFGYGTPPRYSQFSRLCGYFLLTNCPGTYAGYDTFSNTTTDRLIANSEDAIINSTIPANLTEIFSSATSTDGSTLSSAFDVQFRTWQVSSDVTYKLVDAGRPYSKGSYRTIESLMLNNKTQAVEGLVVDTVRSGNTVRGGIGLRNHTIPSGLPYGGRWTEDLLWIEPVTTCVDTNLTFSFTQGESSNITRAALIDNGGFSDLSSEYPYPGEWNDTQNPDLQARAYKGAWISNALSAVFLNVTHPGGHGFKNTTKGREFSLGESDLFRPLFNYRPVLNKIQLSPIDGGYLNLAYESNNVTGMNLSTTAQAMLGITSENFTFEQVVCPGYGGGDDSNSTHMMVACGYLYGAPQRQDGVESLIFEPYKDWTQNLYVCATGVRASIKIVGFSINGSSSLSNLQIVSLDDKHYPDHRSKPLWAVEETNLNISDINALWGLVDDRYETAEGLATLRAEKFWLPAVKSLATITSSVDSIASSSAFGSALNDVYNNAAGFSSDNQLADYSGIYNMAMSRLWGNMSTSPTTASGIINLIYTDIISTAVTGTKSAIRQSAARAGPGSPNAVAHVTEYTRQIHYNWLFAIPAAVIVAATVLALLFILIMMIVSRFSISYMRQLLNQTSTGRIVTNILYPELSHATAPTSKWVDQAGSQRLAFAKVPKREAVDPMNKIGTGSLHRRMAPLTFGQAETKKIPLNQVLCRENPERGE